MVGSPVERMVALPEYLHINLAGKHVIFLVRNFIFLLTSPPVKLLFRLISRAELAEQTEKHRSVVGPISILCPLRPR